MILKEQLNKLGNFPFVFILMGLAMFFWLNGKAFFEAWGASNEGTITVYLLMMVVFLVWSNKESLAHLKMPLKDAIPGYLLGMFITFGIMNIVIFFGVMSTPLFPPELFWPTVIMQICIVSVAEEIIFRGILLESTGILISSVLFAGWHTYAYSFIWHTGGWETFNWGAMIFVFGMGILLAIIVEHSRDLEKQTKIKLGFPAAMAIHATYNLCVLGALYWVI